MTLGQVQEKINRLVDEINLKGNTRARAARYRKLKELRDELEGLRENAGVLDSIRRGDRVTIVNRFGQERTGKAVMRGPHGWVLNMGGRYGTPAVATEANIVKIGGRRNAGIRERRARGTKTGRFPGSMRLTKKRIKKRRMATPTYAEAVSGKFSRKRLKQIKYGRTLGAGGRPVSPTLLNPVRGRKVKGGRSVTLRNFTGTIVKRSDGTVNILGRGRKR